MMSTAELRMSTLGPAKQREGSRSTMVMLALGEVRSSQNAKTPPAIPDPEMRMLRFEVRADSQVVLKHAFLCCCNVPWRQDHGGGRGISSRYL